MNNFYTVDEVAEKYRVDPETVRRWLRKGILKGFKTPSGYSWIIPASALEDFTVPDTDADAYDGHRGHGS